MSFLDALLYGFTRYQWFRKWRGGRWELWWVDSPINAAVWHHRSVEEDMDQRPTAICRGTPIIEDYRCLAKVVKETNGNL